MFIDPGMMVSTQRNEPEIPSYEAKLWYQITCMHKWVIPVL